MRTMGPTERSRSSRIPDQGDQVHGLEFELLAPRECEHALSKGYSALGRLNRIVQQAQCVLVVRQALAQQLQAPGYGHQQITEIVRRAAGELADHFHFLRLAQPRFGRAFSR